jgi:hypothetical protein
VGSEQAIRWTGAGAVDLSLSADGGATWTLLDRAVSGGARVVRVPHVPSRFARIRVERATPFASAVSDSFFKIDATIILLVLTATKRDDGGGVRVTWQTDPAPPIIAGYDVERSAAGGEWKRLNDDLLTGGEITDRPEREDALRYRVSAVNGLGESFVLGETDVRAALGRSEGLLVYPNPAGDGGARILFRARSLDGSGRAETEVLVRDAAGRLVRRLPLGRVRDGDLEAAWDGRDDAGHRAASGVYLVEVRSSGLAPRRAKLTLAR